MFLSVIICTHNPRPEYLKRVLEALEVQSLSKERWELLLIDNASTKPLAEKWSFFSHPNAFHIREEILGLTEARLRGMKEAKGEYLLFVDDDNLLNSEYLAHALIILNSMPWLGAIGGQILPEYEIPPPEWLPLYERVLAIRRVDKARWSNAIDDWQSQPWGAGMVVRKSVCDRYRFNLEKLPCRKQLGRIGTSLISGEDIDIVLTALELSLGFGVFPEMQVTHLIPKRRMTEEYICQIARGLVASNLWLAFLRGNPVDLPPKRTLYTEVRQLYQYMNRSRFSRLYEKVTQSGVDDFKDLVQAQTLGSRKELE